MAYGWQILLNSVDISDKVSGFSITSSLDSYCREMTLDIADASLYASLDFSQISESPEIEILTKNGTAFISQGTFFIERPAIIDNATSELMTGVWGRSLTAMLGEPFTPKVSKTWTERTTFLGIVEEMCNLAGFTWNASYCEIDDFVIYANTYEADGVYPIDVITELAELAGALVTTDRNNHLCVKQIDYAPTTAYFTITDADISELSESPEWPTFGNRISITPTGSTSGYSVELTVSDECLSADSASRTKLYAQVTDEDNEPVNGIVVDWSIDSTKSALSYTSSNTQTVLISNEAQSADNFYDVSVEFEPTSVLGVWAASDTARATNLAKSGYAINDNTITLTQKLSYCNQSLVISYYSPGIAVNFLTAGSTAENVIVTADVEGSEGTGTVYVDNPCQCPPSIALTAAPTTIYIATSGGLTAYGKASLLVYVEESGPVSIGKYVFMSQTSATKRGTLGWTKARLGKVSISDEESTVINDIDGISQCEISMYPASVTSVYLADEDGEETGSNLYKSHNGKRITLNTEQTTGDTLLVTYVAQGAALNSFTAAELGTAQVTAWITSTLEEGCKASCTIDIESQTATTDDYPSDYSDEEAAEEDGGSGGEDGDYDPGATDGSSTTVGSDPCYTTSVSDNPTAAALAGRFAAAVAAGCDCHSLCEREFVIYGTTQNYDNASGRTIDEIISQDYGYEIGSAEYYEMYAALKAESILDCWAQCDDCNTAETLEIDTSGTAETIDPGGSSSLLVAGGVGPYTYSTTSAGYTIAGIAGKTAILTSASGTCGTDYDATAKITITDTCGQTADVIIRNTAGQWAGGWGVGIGCGEQAITSQTAYTTYNDYSIKITNSCGADAPTLQIPGLTGTYTISSGPLAGLTLSNPCGGVVWCGTDVSYWGC